jgi:LacI family sucrose operon transcriptional repressor
MKKITLQDIARLAGVSKTTVSAVLNNRAKEYGIRAETEQKVKDIAKQFNYAPNKMARGLRLKKTQTIGLVIPDLSNWFFSQIAGFLYEVAAEADYHLYVTSSKFNEKEEHKTINDLLAWHIDGLIVASMMKKEQIPRNFLHSQIPIVYIDRRIESENISWVASDNQQGAYDLINYMCSTGIREICYLGANQNISTLVDRLEGYRRALDEHGIRFNPELVVFTNKFTAADGYQLVKTLFTQRKGFPEAIFAASCDFMVGVLRFLKDEFQEIPQTLKLAAYDNHELLDFLSVKFPSVQQDTARMAQAAFSLLTRAMNGERNVQHQLIPTKLIIRA